MASSLAFVPADSANVPVRHTLQFSEQCAQSAHLRSRPQHNHSRRLLSFLNSVPNRHICRVPTHSSSIMLDPAFFFRYTEPMDNKVSLSNQGASRDEVFSQLQQLHEQDTKWHDGRVFSLVYHANDEHTEFLKKVYSLYFHENGLNPGAFPSIKKYESEVVSIAANLLGGGETAAGAMTSGGSESIMMAVKTYRDWALATKQISQPEMILSNTVHPAFDKALHYFRVKPVIVKVTDEQIADVEAIKNAITPNTIAIVGSAPQYPHGVMDPIEALAKLARANQIGMHVDACVGGFMLPFLKKLGEPIPPFDFSVEGVTSISADLHKYGFTAKGASVILYRDKDLRRFQFFVKKDWPGGLFASPSVTGTRPAGSIAAAWATLKAFGEEGYLKLYGELLATTKKFKDGLEVQNCRIVGKPVGTLLAYETLGVNMHVVADLLEKRGWFVDRQMNPDCIHLTITPAHAPIVDRYLGDLKECREFAKGHPELAREGMAAMYGMVATVPDPKMVDQFLYQYMDQRYET
jgi:sphinganine-1-phosphate aldolase